MLRLAITVAGGALARTESRGAHSRTDYPLRNDRDWLNRTLVRWFAGEARPTFSYEPVGLLELSPGHRGYGSDERIEMLDGLDGYNDAVLSQQTENGRPASKETIGSRLISSTIAVNTETSG
jgi:fumarate reductase flavoprotein subunit